MTRLVGAPEPAVAESSIAQKKVTYDQMFGSFAAGQLELALNVLMVFRLQVAHEQQSVTAVQK